MRGGIVHANRLTGQFLKYHLTTREGWDSPITIHYTHVDNDKTQQIFIPDKNEIHINLEKIQKDTRYFDECVFHMKRINSLFISSEYLNFLNLNCHFKCEPFAQIHYLLGLAKKARIPHISIDTKYNYEYTSYLPSNYIRHKFIESLHLYKFPSVTVCCTNYPMIGQLFILNYLTYKGIQNLYTSYFYNYRASKAMIFDAEAKLERCLNKTVTPKVYKILPDMLEALEYMYLHEP